MGRAGQTKCQSSGRLELLYKSDPNITTDGGHMEIILVQGLGQSADVWQPVQKQLRVPSRTFDVFAGLTPNDSLTLSDRKSVV